MSISCSRRSHMQCSIWQQRLQVFDRSTGSCSMTSKRERCFSEDSTIDNSKTVIRLGRRDWLSHDLMRSVAGLLLSEKLGYSV